MTELVRIALNRPYTFVVLALLILIIGPLAAMRTPTDIFPDIRIPVISVVWQYTGLPPDQMAGRIITPLRAHADDDRQRYRAHRTQSYQRHRHRQDLLPADRRHPHRHRAGHLGFADRAQADAAGRDAAADPQLQRVDGSDHPARAVGRGALPSRTSATIAINSVAPAAGDRARRGDSRIRTAASTRQMQIDVDPQALQAQGSVRAGRRQRACRAEPDHAGRHREDRQLRIQHPAQQRSAEIERTERPAGQDRQRRDDLHPRRRACARRQSAADRISSTSTATAPC